MFKKGILRKFVPTALGILFFGTEANFLPVFGQSASTHLNTIASIPPSPHTSFGHHPIDLGAAHFCHHTGNQSTTNNPWTHTTHQSTTNNPWTHTTNQSASNNPWTHTTNQSASNNQSQPNNNNSNSSHVFNYVHHHNQTTASNILNNQATGFNMRPHIGGYHAGYIMHHHDLQQNSGSSLAQQNGFGFHHHLNISTQDAITLSGSKSANGSLLGSVTLPSFLNLNLSSSQAIIRADNSVPVMITIGGFLGANGNIVGGIHQLITPGQMLTAAQYAAMEQVVISGQQTLVLSGHGTAISGLITLVAGQVNSLAGLVVPTHVAVDTVGFTNSNALSIAGLTQINGSLYTLEQTANITSALNATSLMVGGHGLISTNLSSLSLFNSLFAANGLNIGILGSLTNQGVINSNGNLNISANQIANVSTPNHIAVMSAQTLNLYSASGNITNSGQLIANNGNINFNTAAAQNLNINNTTGTIQALQGAINLRDTSYLGSANINLNDGDWLSKEVNLNSGTGIATANIRNVSGSINTNAGEAHIAAATQNLIIGNTNLSGDPSYFNIIGNVTISGTLNFSGQDLAIVASNNIVKAGSGSINTSSSTGNGGNILMIAGANVSNSGSNTSATNNSADTLTVKGGNSVGGHIELTGLSELNSSSTHSGSNGGNITAVAYGGTASNSGSITLPSTVTITTGGAGSGTNGNVNIIAGATSGTAINIGNINTTGGTGGGGNITLLTQAPVISGAPAMTIKDGSITNGSTFIGSGNNNAASLVVGNLTSPGGTITAKAGQALIIGSVTANALNPNTNGGNIILYAARTSLSNLQVNGNINANGLGSGNGGTIDIKYNDTTNPLIVGTAGSNSHTSYINGNISANGGASGSGGNINISNSGNGTLGLTLSGNITANGSTLGNLNFTSQNGQAINVSGPGSLIGIINNNVSAANVLYSSGVGNLTLGNVSNTSGNITASANNANGSVYTTQNITSAGTLNLTSGSNGSVNIANSTIASGVGININTPTLAVGNNAVLNATTGELIIQSNGPNNALAVNLSSGSSIIGTNVWFNSPAAPGAITINSGVGTITATGNGQILLSGGTGAVIIKATSVNGRFYGFGPNYLAGSSVTVNVTSGNLNIANLTSPGAISFVNQDNSVNNGNIQLINLSSTGASVTLTSGSTGFISVGNQLTANTGINLTTSTLYNGGIISTTNGDLNIQSNGAGNALTVYSNPNSQLTSVNGNVNFNPYNAGAISIPLSFGGLQGTISANGGNGNITLNGGTGAVVINALSTNGYIVGAGLNNLAGSSVNVTVSNVFLTIGDLSSPGVINLTNQNPNYYMGIVLLQGNLTSTGASINVTSGTAGLIQTHGNVTAQTGINITTPDFYNGVVTSTATGNINIQSNDSHYILIIYPYINSQLTAITGNVNYNPFNAGSISMPQTFGAPQSTVTANGGNGLITFNGGAGAVTFNAMTINGIITGAGPGNLAGSSVNVLVTKGNLTISNLSSPGVITLTNQDNSNTAGSIVTTGVLSSTGASINLTTGIHGSITVANSIKANTGINMITSILSNAGNVSTQTGDLNIQSNGAGNALSVYFFPNSQLIATSGNVNFNPTTAGAIAVTYIFSSTAIGTISANGGNGLITLNGGTGSTAINIMSINGILVGAGAGYLAGSSVNVSVTKGNITIGNLSSPGIVTFTNLDNSNTAGKIYVTAALSSTGSSVNLSSGTAGFTNAGNITVNNGASIIANTGISLVTPYLINNGNISTQTGNLNIQSNGNNNALAITLGSGAALIAVTGNVNFNPIHAGSITIPFGGSFPLLGTISANGGNGQVNLNIGTGTATIWVGSIAGTVQDPNANFSSPAAGSVLILVSSGQLTVGNFATSSGNDIQAINEGTNGALVTAGNIQSGAAITLIGGNNGSLTIGSGNYITAATDIFAYAPIQNINGIVTATNGYIVLQSYGTNNSLVVNMGPAVGGVPTQLTAINGNVNFNTTIAGAITITGGPSNGLISANNNDVVLNGGTGAVNTNNQQIIGCIHVNGSSINMQTSVGDLDFCIGINTSSGSGSGGNITIAANGGAINSGAITTNGSGAGNSAGNITLSASTGMNLGDINANGLNGASGGAVTISLPGQTITGTFISAVGNGGGNGGSITTTSGKLVLTGVDSQGNSIDANGGNTGGNITIITTAPQAFIVGNGDSSGNGTRGNISANGVNGGFIILANNSSPGGANQIINGQVTANGTTGSGGKVELEVEPFGSATLTTIFNGGLVQATNNANNSGRVGFNGGPGQAINILGTGTINGGEFVHVGNLDRITLEYLDGHGSTINISPTVKITNNFSTNGFLSLSTSNSSALNFPPPYYPPTDFTPWGHFHYQEFQPKKERAHFALGLAYKRRTTAYIPGTKSYSHIFTGSENDRLARDGMNLLSTNAENYLSIDKGNILLSPDKNIVIGTHEGQVAMSPGAIAFVMESGSDVVVYNLRQSAPNQVSITVNSHKIILHPGNMLVLTRQKVDDFENIDADCHMISYRGAQEIPMNDKDVKAFIAQYSIASAITAVEPLKELIASSNTEDAAVFNKIIKSAVLLGDFTSTIDTAQLANLDRDINDRMINTDEKVIDSAKQMATSKNQPVQ